MLDKKVSQVLEIIDPRSAGYSFQTKQMKNDSLPEVINHIEDITSHNDNFSLGDLYGLNVRILGRYDYDMLDDYYPDLLSMLKCAYGNRTDRELYLEGMIDATEIEINQLYMRAWNKDRMDKQARYEVSDLKM